MFTILGKLRSSGNVLLVAFDSDPSVTGRGWSLGWTFVAGASTRGALVRTYLIDSTMGLLDMLPFPVDATTVVDHGLLAYEHPAASQTQGVYLSATFTATSDGAFLGETRTLRSLYAEP